MSDPPDVGSLERPFRIFADNRYVGTIDAFSSDDAKERWRITSRGWTPRIGTDAEAPT
jgi:hypothetical protein